MGTGASETFRPFSIPQQSHEFQVRNDINALVRLSHTLFKTNDNEAFYPRKILLKTQQPYHISWGHSFLSLCLDGRIAWSQDKIDLNTGGKPPIGKVVEQSGVSRVSRQLMKHRVFKCLAKNSDLAFVAIGVFSCTSISLAPIYMYFVGDTLRLQAFWPVSRKNRDQRHTGGGC